ncbi:MAG: hypothetical protein QGG09_15265, partial [Pirellulaceae bacterium]|nr:hypothetical protein [Pirellulaceae bacterium]
MDDDPQKEEPAFSERKMIHPWLRLLAMLAILGIGANVGAARYAAQTGQLQSTGNSEKQAGGGESPEKKVEPPDAGTPEPTVDPELK